MALSMLMVLVKENIYLLKQKNKIWSNAKKNIMPLNKIIKKV